MNQDNAVAEALERLAALATPGPWEEEYDPIDSGDHATAICIPGYAGQPGTFIAYCQHNWNDAYAGERRISWKEAESNASLIVALRNNLPTIIAALKARRVDEGGVS